MTPRKLLYISILLIGCGGKLEQQSYIDSVSVDSTTKLTTETPGTDTPPLEIETKTIVQNFYGISTEPLTENEGEVKIWELLKPLIEQYDTTAFNTISKNYTMPGTEETADETINTSTTATITLFYNDAQELKAVWREYSYELGDPSRFEKITTLYLFDNDLIAFYEDSDVSIDMAYQRYKRGVGRACPDCGVIMSAGVSSDEVIVSGNLNDKDFISLAKAARNEELFLEYAHADSFQSNGNEYIYQTAEPLNEEADYDVFYTANKGYYEKFIKPKLIK
ncbi:MAG: hypothetical protein KF763_09700 [Cyclobacteriaceae bacterium]|nr:hypothetical protein [Cyclobacteriaceae bacterium]